MRSTVPDPHARERGAVVRFNPAEGHGRIRADKDGKDLFVHLSKIQGDGFRMLQEGQRVEFTRQAAPDGWHAHHVMVVENGAV